MPAPYALVNGHPELTDSVVLFLDILGSEDMANDSRAQDHLERLFNALSSAQEGVLEKDEAVAYRVITFTDNLVLGLPLPRDDDEESALGYTFFAAAYYQYELTRHDFFVRGGLTCGPLFMGDDFVFGRGLIEAHDIERKVAVQPRIVLSERALRLAWEHTRYYSGGVSESPQNAMLLFSGETEAFLNYLEVLNEPDTDMYEELVRHKAAVERALAKWSTTPRVGDKYRWLAAYHNYFCERSYPNITDLVINDAAVTNFVTLAEIQAASDRRKRSGTPELHQPS